MVIVYHQAIGKKKKFQTVTKNILVKTLLLLCLLLRRLGLHICLFLVLPRNCSDINLKFLCSVCKCVTGLTH